MTKDKIVSLPITRGNGRNPHISDFMNLIPVNMLTIPPKIIIESGYMRSFPGIEKRADVDGVSRGVMKNAADGMVYRACGRKLYRSGVAVMDIPGDDKTERLTLAGSAKTIALNPAGKMIFYNADGSTAELDNWPPSQYFAGSQGLLTSGSKPAYDGSLTLTESMVDKGSLKLAITPATSDGMIGTLLEITTIQKTYNQEAPATGTPYLTDVVVSGFSISGTTLTLSYTFNANGATGDDATEFSWSQIVEPTNVKNAQFELGEVEDITHANARYAWLKKGTNTFGVTDIEDETKPDRYRPFMTAEAFPDPAVGIGAVGGDIVVFGTVSTEYFTLTGSSDTTKPIYKSQQAMMIPVGIAGVHCKALVGDEFAVISHPAGGKVSVYLLGDGRAKEIATPEIISALASASADELAAGIVQAISFGIHSLIIVRFADYVFCYDLTSKNWCQLTAGSTMQPYSAIDYINDLNGVTVGDVAHGVTGQLTDSIASQYGTLQEHILYTPMMSAPNAVLADLELEAITGTAQHVERMMVAATTDGTVFPREMLVLCDGPQAYNTHSILPSVGYVAKNIGFRFRAFSSTPFTVASCKVRIT